MFELSKTYRFEASHRLPNHDGKCARMHGHSWEVTVVFRGTHLATTGPKTGMLLDYGEITRYMKPILEELDHHHLNDFIENPTSERVAIWILDRLVRDMTENLVTMLAAVEIGETCTSRCKFGRLFA